ncbi:hypothetical protein EDD59_12317 [Muricomes intestini]|uniref:O-antigen ligase-like membrane protein n=1 Tax=Muricomes intestini TaxID=1796634 RepID=A0A4R3K2J9_9FIRM|nr:hypothetical protein [Muricomes intestini]TCS76635.1 hypothetical protein EDD59_12317 [Muricomes intestini]
MIQNIDKRQLKGLLDNIYLIVFAIMIGHYFLLTTTFEIVWPQYFYANLRTFLLVIIIAKTAAEDNISYIDILLGVIAGIVFLVAWKHNGYEVLSNIVLLIVGCRGIPFRKIAKTYFIICSILLVITMMFALTGKIENFVLNQNGRRTRIAFGIVYPTDFSAHVFYLVLAYCYLREEKIKYLEIGVITALGIFVYAFCDARLNTICILLTAGVMGYNKIRHDMTIKKGKSYNMNAVFSILLCLSTILASMAMIGLTLLYSQNRKWTLFLDHILNNRLKLGKKGIDVYGFSIFGQQINLIGSGNRKATPANYFFLDSSYLFVPLLYGILVLGVILLLFLVMSFRARKEKDWTLLWLICIMSLQCVVEHHIVDISYNILLWGTLASLEKNVQCNQKTHLVVSFLKPKFKLHKQGMQ